MLPNIGDYLVTDMFNEFVLIVRGQDGVIRAFSNFCRHRGSSLLTGRGNISMIRCPVHSWCYSLDGKLTRVPRPEGICHFDFDQYGLKPVRIERWDGLAQDTGTHAPSLFRLLRALQTTELIAQQDDGRFVPGHLNANSRDAARAGVESYRAWVDLLYTLRTGKSAFERIYGKRFYEYIQEDTARIERWDQAMAAVARDWIPAVLEVYDFTHHRVVADIGGGQGLFLAELLKLYPTMHGILFDQPHVIKGVRAKFQQAGLANRCIVVGGSFFDRVPTGADIYMICNTLADWNDRLGLDLLKACRRSIEADGTLLVVDRLLPPDDHPEYAELTFFDLFFLVLEEGRIRTQDEYAQLFKRAQFRLSRVLSTSSQFTVIQGEPI
ncbi:methyltransferase [Candidatus Entotheonella palauensis]|uniref:methyltransferase n=1 Tax=Candidatus Entotheonella palauensis TaxID=93172 RepID=UPI0015C47DAA|nr:methyltransferase [Candidatus Entotheonella palauensis]